VLKSTRGGVGLVIGVCCESFEGCVEDAGLDLPCVAEEGVEAIKLYAVLHAWAPYAMINPGMTSRGWKYALWSASVNEEARSAER
jgi:hypothetical protein